MGQRRRAKSKKPKIVKSEDAGTWRDRDLLDHATMHAGCVAEQLEPTSDNPEMMNASVGAAMLANAMYLHVQGCNDPKCDDCVKHSKLDWRALAHTVLDLHLTRALMINLETEGHA